MIVKYRVRWKCAKCGETKTVRYHEGESLDPRRCHPGEWSPDSWTSISRRSRSRHARAEDRHYTRSRPSNDKVPQDPMDRTVDDYPL